MIVPQYSVCCRKDCSNKKIYYVITTDRGVEFIVTKFTRSKTLAAQWCKALRRTAQIEADRARAARG